MLSPFVARDGRKLRPRFLQLAKVCRPHFPWLSIEKGGLGVRSFKSNPTLIHGKYKVTQIIYKSPGP
jgi:hypothetical protein